MKDLRQLLVYFCLASVIAITIPLFLLNKFWYSQQPYESAGIISYLSTAICYIIYKIYHSTIAILNQALQNSILLERAHIL